MRLPENPPSDEEHKLFLEQDDNKTIVELRPYLSIVNSDYLHWDELPMRFKGINLDLKRLWSYATLVREFNTKPIKLNGLTLRYVITPKIEKALHDVDMRVGGKFDFESQMPSTDLRRKYLVFMSSDLPQ